MYVCAPPALPLTSFDWLSIWEYIKCFLVLKSPRLLDNFDLPFFSPFFFPTLLRNFIFDILVLMHILITK
jgi:hypothetical protein